MAAPTPITEPQHVHMRIKRESTDFRYSATVGTDDIEHPEELRVNRGDFITFENSEKFILRFAESPFENPEKTVLYAEETESGWTVPARVRGTAILRHRYHYTVIMGDNSTDDPEIIIER